MMVCPSKKREHSSDCVRAERGQMPIFPVLEREASRSPAYPRTVVIVPVPCAPKAEGVVTGKWWLLTRSLPL